MQMLAFVDMHGNMRAIEMLVKKAKGADLLVCAGDFSDWGRNMEGILKKFDGIGKPLLMIPGNHELEDELRELCQKFKFIYYLHKASYEIKNYAFFGYGGGGFSMENEEFERLAERFRKTVKPASKIILITHGPPYGTNLDKLPGTGFRGCKSLKRFIIKAKPLLHICGHLHENAGNTDAIGKTIIINPGPSGMLIKI